MKSSLHDIVLAGQDGIESLVGFGKDVKNVIRWADEERQIPRPQPRALEVAWTARGHRMPPGVRGPHVPAMALTAPLGLPTMPTLAAEGCVPVCS
jgi:hypothetical protein